MVVKKGSNLRSRKFLRKSKRLNLRSISLYLLILVLVSVVFYGVLDRVANLGDGLGFLVSFSRTPFGLDIGAVSIGYLTIALLLILVAIILANRRLPIHMSKSGVATMIVLSLILGGAFAAFQVPVGHQWPNKISDSGEGFTLNVEYGPISFRAGDNITLNYVLDNDNYSSTDYYLNFGGQFSMVFYDSAGHIIKAFKVPISFQLSQGQNNIAFVPGQSWTTILSWGGNINDTSTLAPTGNYTLASYAVLQDANQNLYVDLNTRNLTIQFNN